MLISVTTWLRIFITKKLQLKPLKKIKCSWTGYWKTFSLKKLGVKILKNLIILGDKNISTCWYPNKNISLLLETECKLYLLKKVSI